MNYSLYVTVTNCWYNNPDYIKYIKSFVQKHELNLHNTSSSKCYKDG